MRFHGHMARPDLQDHDPVRRRVTVVPSRWHENQPLAVLESFALGVPVLGTDLGGLPEMVDDETGWVVPANDDEAMAAALVACPRGSRGAPTSAGSTRASGWRSGTLPATHLKAIESIYEEAGVAS